MHIIHIAPCIFVMANLKSGIILKEGENLVMELEAEMWATSSNPIAKLWGSIVKFLNKLIGVKRDGYVVITDQRVVEVVKHKVLWVIDAGKYITYLMPSSIKEVGYTKEPTCFCFCQAYYLFYEGFTQRTNVLLQSSNEAEAQRIVDAFYNALTK